MPAVVTAHLEKLVTNNPYVPSWINRVLFNRKLWKECSPLVNGGGGIYFWKVGERHSFSLLKVTSYRSHDCVPCSFLFCPFFCRQLFWVIVSKQMWIADIVNTLGVDNLCCFLLLPTNSYPHCCHTNNKHKRMFCWWVKLSRVQLFKYKKVFFSRDDFYFYFLVYYFFNLLQPR